MDELNAEQLNNITAGVNPSNTTHIANQKEIIANFGNMTSDEALEKYKNKEITTDQLASVIGEEHEVIKAAREFEALDGTVNLQNDIKTNAK